MDEALLDTDIVSEVLKGKNPQVLAAAQQYLAARQRMAFSAVTIYEVLRGLHAKRATRQLTEFLRTVATSDVLPVTVPVLMRAAELWADARRAGHPRNDADLIIAATAIEARRVLVTGNTSHFSWIPGLVLSDWRVGGGR